LRRERRWVVITGDVQRRSPGDTTRNQDDARRWRVGALACCGALALGCSTTIGATGVYAVHPDKVASLGTKTASMLNLGLFDTKAHLAAGVESQVMQRLTKPSNAWGNWRLLALAGITHMPKPQEFRLGYEVLIKGGVARDDSDGSADLLGVLGASLGSPIRLTSSAPLWRADDLAGVGVFVVPELGFSTLGFDDALELSAGLSLRVNVWSAITP
jgi:hypothetical protein